MDSIGVVTLVSIFASLASVVLAIVAIALARTAERQSRENYEKTNNMMVKYYTDTKDVLAEIDKRASVTEKTVTNTQEKMLTTITSIVNETIIPKKEDMSEKFGLMLMQMMMTDPEGAKQLLDTIKPFAEMGKRDPEDRET